MPLAPPPGGLMKLPTPLKLLAPLPLLFLLAACPQQGPLENFGENVDDVVDDIGDEIDDARR